MLCHYWNLLPMQLCHGVGSRWMPTARAAQWEVEGSLHLRQPHLQQHSSPVTALPSMVQVGLQLAMRHKSGGPARGVRGRPCRQQ